VYNTKFHILGFMFLYSFGLAKFVTFTKDVYWNGAKIDVKLIQVLHVV
jgi:hypothetical protein